MNNEVDVYRRAQLSAGTKYYSQKVCKSSQIQPTISSFETWKKQMLCIILETVLIWGILDNDDVTVEDKHAASFKCYLVRFVRKSGAVVL